ncbi:hydrolase or acyltransferase of alpha/beta superfamily protein [Haloferax mucosum ATCC BAA-1512]|uniref:Hydrolase or acyltransferase of alpha/beta superfamily protein n=1 Tax=Haloferax mucosum ATCC BAA-1512 TaxID=662479 RepID=M0IGQ5_9EURY|nr:alpha/beta hydrolase [Haloferax mucosum]ELZ95946.1 hydrolase or acyltransferase of alpha/beta superfamily protein [Haloferax mucosum ATCC BAA-1512]
MDPKTVTSADGTEIAYERTGDGPPMLLLHGASATRRSWDTIRPHLAEEFSLYIPDRRGRGDSGDNGGDGYSLDREVADVRALVEAVDGTPTIFGHSFGGLVALAAAPTLSLDRLVLYEPALLVGEHRGDDLADRMQARLDAGERQDALRLFIEDAGGVPTVETLPWWPEEANTHLTETVIRENYQVEAYELDSEPNVDVPTLVVSGERSSNRLRDAASEVHERLPESRFVELDGVGHIATESAPERLATAVKSFVRETKPDVKDT